MSDSPTSRRPVVWRSPVLPEWIDRNGHMNAGFYMVAFDTAVGPWFDYLGVDDAYRAKNNASTFSIEGHITWNREVREGDPLRIEAQLLGYDDKKAHTYMEMLAGDEGYVAATHELLSIHIDMGGRRSAPFREGARERLAEVLALHSALERPSGVGRVIRTKS